MVISLLIITLLMFGDVLFTSKPVVLSYVSTDICRQFYHWRGFGFGQLQQGNLALWNPHIYSGAPFFGGSQSALLYPLNVIFLMLPLETALNWSIALHVFLAGLFMYLWTSYRRLHPLASLFASILFMFSGPFFLHIFAGHLSNISSMIWAPLIFLSIDGFQKNRTTLKWILIGMCAVSMQILGGHLQYVYYTGIAAMLYSILLLFKTKDKVRFALSFGVIYVGAVCICAIQLFTGIEAAAECIRSKGVTYYFASMCSFPPENLITFIAPKFLGDRLNIPYFGRWYLWEMSAFIGVSGFILALYGAFYCSRPSRRFSITLALVFILLAFGNNIPLLFKVLYNWFPGYNAFRGNSKFIFQAVLFIIMLGALGYDRLLRHIRHKPKEVSLFILTGGIILGLCALLLRYSVTSGNDAIWQSILHWFHYCGEAYELEIYDAPGFASKSGINASSGLFVASAVCLLVALCIFLSRFNKYVIHGIVLLALVEMVLFARTMRPTFDSTIITSSKKSIPQTFRENDYRTQLPLPNIGMTWEVNDIWGEDPYVLTRYAELINYTQGINPDKASQSIKTRNYHKIFRMLRCPRSHYDKNGTFYMESHGRVLPRALLIQNCIIAKERNVILGIMDDDRFDPFSMVILESQPEPFPQKSDTPGKVRIVNESTDHLTLEATTPHPSILLITDTYSKGWKATPLPGSSQTNYTIMPANYILRAIPLTKGHHKIRVEYLPGSFIVGKWFSIISFFVYIGFCLRYWFNSYKCHLAETSKKYRFVRDREQ